MNPIVVYETVEVAYPYKLRGVDQSAPGINTGLLWSPPTSKIPNVGLPATAAVETRHGGIRLGMASLHNRSGGVAVVGIGGRIPGYLWLAGQWTEGTTTFTDDTTDAQDAGATDFPLETTTADSGYVILCRIPFNAISIDVGTASVDAVSVAREVRYNIGDTWQAAPANLFLQDNSATNYAITTTPATESVIVWEPWVDWTQTLTDGGLGTNIPKGYYAINVRATDAPGTTAGVADALSIYRLYFLTEAVADNGVYEVAPVGEHKLPVECDALVAFFSVANAGNRVLCQVRSGG